MVWSTGRLWGAMILVVAMSAVWPGGVLAGDVQRGLTVAQAGLKGPPASKSPPGGPAKPAVPSQNSGSAAAGTSPNNASAQAGEGAAGRPEAYSYDPSSRRDPFYALVQRGEGERPDGDLPPLQRVGLTEVGLIGIIWGGFGFTAMVQTPDGKGYAVRRGTRIGPSNGVVSKITENEIVVTERYTDTFGRVQEREFIKQLHPSEE